MLLDLKGYRFQIRLNNNNNNKNNNNNNSSENELRSDRKTIEVYPNWPTRVCSI
jgi:hypothetical protein